MKVKFKNNAVTTLSGNITNSATSITVTDGSVFPTITGDEYFIAVISDSPTNFEIVKVTARSTNTLTVVRNQESSGAKAFNSGARIQNRLTAGELENLGQSGGGLSTSQYNMFMSMVWG